MTVQKEPDPSKTTNLDHLVEANKMVRQTTAPNPGSPEAERLGCTCPVLDNAGGRGYLGSGHFWITGGCPVHAPAVPTAEDIADMARLFPEGEARPIVMTPREVADMQAAMKELDHGN